MITANQTLLKAIHRVTKKVEDRQKEGCPEPEMDMCTLNTEGSDDAEDNWLDLSQSSDESFHEATFAEMKQSLFEVPDQQLCPPSKSYIQICHDSLLNVTTNLIANSNICPEWLPAASEKNGSSPTHSVLSITDEEYLSRLAEIPIDEIELAFEEDHWNTKEKKRKMSREEEVRLKRARIDCIPPIHSLQLHGRELEVFEETLP